MLHITGGMIREMEGGGCSKKGSLALRSVPPVSKTQRNDQGLHLENKLINSMRAGRA